MSVAAILTAATAAATPVPEALELARQIAAQGTLAQIAPLQTSSEVEQMIARHRDLSAADQARLRAIGKDQAGRLVARVVEAEAAAMATRLSLDDLHALAAAANSPAAQHQRAALPAIMRTTVQTLGTVDYAGGVRAAFCHETGKLCSGD